MCSCAGFLYSRNKPSPTNDIVVEDAIPNLKDKDNNTVAKDEHKLSKVKHEGKSKLLKMQTFLKINSTLIIAISSNQR